MTASTALTGYAIVLAVAALLLAILAWAGRGDDR